MTVTCLGDLRVVEGEPRLGLEVLDHRVVVTSTRRTRVDHDGKKLVHQTTLGRRHLAIGTSLRNPTRATTSTIFHSRTVTVITDNEKNWVERAHGLVRRR